MHGRIRHVRAHSGRASTASTGFPVGALAVAIGVGIPAFAAALLFALTVATYLGPQFDVVIINDHVIGGTGDRVAWMTAASVFGAAGLFCVLRFWMRLNDWRRERDTEMSRVAPR